MKSKNLSLTVLLVTFLTTTTFAQDKYDYMNIISDSYNKSLSVSKNGTQFYIYNLELPKGERHHTNSNALLKKVAEYQNEGWEVVSLASVPMQPVMGGGEYHYSHSAYLRKKVLESK